ncbi:MAG: thymidylate synthase [Nanoarchaeota archaeon]|nr:thymidylate synthase [Nanoarchaeota archaeon]MBU1704749.1 thymidylate synthase [Nanoarchaeota archaeon]
MQAYLNIVKKILETGVAKQDRTGVGTIAIAGEMFEHNMEEGFPLLTTKSVPLRLVASELEFFVKGISDKRWLQDRDNHIWDEWCSPKIVPYAHDEKTKKMMLEERDLGPIYGWQWRHFGAQYKDYKTDYTGKGIDQVKRIVDLLKTNPDDRQMLVLAWNPMDIDKVIPPFCHYGYQVTVLDGKLNLMWNQRSVDVALGLPFNIASYGLLLHILAKETGLKEGKLVGFLGDAHIYKNHVDGLREQISREPKKLPKIKTNNFTSIFEWKYTDSEVEGYEHHPRIKFEIAV